MFHCKLHSIPESTLKGYKNHFLIAIFTIFIIFGVKSIISKIFISTESVIMDHIVFLANLINQLIMLKYLISQNPNLKLYVNVYHHQPPPVLPWQLPDDFDPGDIKILVVKSKYK